MRKGSKARLANGIVSAAIVVFFLAHAMLGSLSALFGVTSPFKFLVWVGVGLIGVHVVVSIITSREQLNDVERPPSPRKKRHLALKWATGGLLIAAAITHIVTVRLYGAEAMQTSATGVLLIIVLAIVLAVHLCVGSKSLLRDLGIDGRYKTAFRVVVCIFAAFFVLAAIAGLWR